ncbi:MAG TPA: tetratricopeptide repeat protein, partial [Archangium sp.]|nr:tetratricopeptide repeat protein [Archangium sp.]
SLNNICHILGILGRYGNALEATREAVEIYRPLAQQNPRAFQPELASNLNNLGAMLSALGHYEEALAALEEAVDKIWPFFEHSPLIFGHNTALMLDSLWDLHESLQRPLPSVFQVRVAIFERLTQL